MEATPNCLRCDTPMEVGFLLDEQRNGFNQGRWCPGFPTKGWVSPVAGKHVKESIPVVSFRCPSCGVLESYALPPIQET